MFKKLFASAVTAALLTICGHAQAAFHLWRIDEIYSNASGTVQYVELTALAGGQQFLNGQSITSSNGGPANSFTFPNNLPGDTSGRKFLVGTTGFAALGLVTPDYVVPNGFLFTANATVAFAGSASVVNYASLPTNGSLSLNRVGTSASFATGTNSPTNFAGSTGTVMPPGAPLLNSLIPGNSQMTLYFSAPASSGSRPITSYTASCGLESTSGVFSPITVTNLLNGTDYGCSVVATSAIGNSAPSNVLTGDVTETDPIKFLVAKSRKTHGAAGPFDLKITPDLFRQQAVTIEPRASGNNHLIVFEFSQTITSVNDLIIETDAGPLPGNHGAVASGKTVLVTLGNVPDNQRLTIILSVNSFQLDTNVSMAFFAGDTTGSGAITASDIVMVKANVGQPVTMQNFRADMNASGDISAGDASAVKARAGKTLQ